MAIVLDIIVGLFVLFMCFIYARKGFLPAILAASSLIVAILCGVFLNAPVKGLLIEKTSLDNKIYQGVYDTCASSNELTFESLQNDAESFINKAENELHLPKSAIDSMRTAVEGAKDREGMLNAISENVTDAAMTVIAFLALFIAATVLLSIIEFIVKKIRDADLLVLHSLDTYGGAVLGCVVAVLILYILLFICECVAASGYSNWLDFVKQSFTGKWMYDHNLIHFLLSLIK